MAVVVQKYGGSSVGDIEKLKAVARRVAETRRRGVDVVVVVSAMGKSTDQLLAMAREVNPSPGSRELDMLLSTGERVAMSLLTLAIEALGVKAISLTGSQSGIITTDSHSNARIIEVRPVRIEDELRRGNVVIVAGFQGMSYKREITTLGRGGSDTTAVALAAALKADLCEICSDVDGVYTADPRCIPDAARLPELTYEETVQLAENGAKVLNPEAVSFAQKHGIVIFAASTFGPQGVGTYIVRARERIPYGRPTGVAFRKMVHLLRFRGAGSDAGAVLNLLREHGLPVYALTIRETSADVACLEGYIPPEDAHGWDSFCAAAARFGDALEHTSARGTVTLVGEGITQGVEVAAEVWRVLVEAGFSPVDLKAGAHRVTAIMPADRVEDAARLLHAHFLSGRLFPGAESL